jgi:AraC-like DNA-binding protein
MIDILHHSSIFIILLIALSLLTNRQSILPNITLSIYLLLRGSILLVATFAEYRQINAIKYSVYLFPLFNHLIPIVSYYYIRANVDNDYKICGKELLYLLLVLPTLSIYIWGALYLNPISDDIIVNFLHSSDSLKDVLLLGQRKFIVLYRVGLQLGFGLYIYNILNKNSYKLSENNKFKWLRSFTLIYFVFFAVNLFQIITYFNNYLTVFNLASTNILKYCSVFAAYTLLYFIIKNPSVIYGHMFTYGDVTKKETLGDLKETLSKSTDSSIIIKNDNSKENELKLCKNKSAQYFLELSGVLIETKVFLKQDLTITDLANQTKIPINYLSYSISQNVGKNFREYINDLRIEHFIAEYEGLSNKYTIDIIAEQSGFRSKATFYTAFKRFTGKTPAEYFRSLENG